MKLSQHSIIHVLLGLALLIGIAMLYLTLAHGNWGNVSPLEWAVLGGAALSLALGSSGPSLVRRWRHLPPPKPLARANIGFCIVVALVGCVLAALGAWYGIWWLMVLGIMLVPFSFNIRQYRATIALTFEIVFALTGVILVYVFLRLHTVALAPNAVPEKSPMVAPRAEPRRSALPPTQKAENPTPPPGHIERAK